MEEYIWIIPVYIAANGILLFMRCCFSNQVSSRMKIYAAGVLVPGALLLTTFASMWLLDNPFSYIKPQDFQFGSTRMGFGHMIGIAIGAIGFMSMIFSQALFVIIMPISWGINDKPLSEGLY